MSNDGNVTQAGGRVRAGRPTLKTIAYMTGLSVTTVSKALNDAPDIGAATKKRVRLIADEIGYMPNRAGVRLRTGKTNVIALILSTETEMFGLSSKLVYGISSRLSGTPYHLVVMPYEVGTDPMIPVRYVVESGSADALIFSRTMPQDPRAIYLREKGVPFATHGRTHLDFEHPYWDFDNETFASIGVKRLAAKGRSRLTLLPAPMDLTYGGLLMRGFTSAIAELGLADIPSRGINIDTDRETFKAEVKRLMSSPNRPDGFVCASPASAIFAITAAESLGYEVGRDFDLVAKESYEVLQQFRKDIIAVHEDFLEAGHGLADAVLKALSGVPANQLQALEVPQI
ncbi:LacI family transcriptional regulator [Amaricoccus tamworthensis]|uniref:LacI family transcriptional regulator n=1 Tax=Amaricoccus tamworthensis TaxID=57002 RepID=UPI003C7A7CE5